MAKNGIQANDTAIPPDTQDLNKENVLQVIDWEIQRAVAASTQPGWTTWAIYGALAAVIWTLLGQFESSQSSMNKVLYYFLISQLCLDLFKQIPSIIAPHRLNYRRPNRFIFTNILASNRYQMAVESVRALLLLLIGRSFVGIVPSTFTYLIYLYYGIAIIISITALLTSYIKWPIPIPSSGSRAIWIVPTLSSILLMVPLLGYIIKLKTDGVSIVDLKVAALLAAAVFLVLSLIEKKSDNPLLSSLIDIRRNLSFGHIAIEDAIKQADIAIAGMQVRDVLQDDIKDIVLSFEKISLEAEQIDARMKTVMNIWPDKICELSPEQREHISKETKQVLARYRDVMILVNNNDECIKKFKRKISWLEAYLKTRPPEISEVLSLLDNAGKESREKFSKNIDTILEMEKKIDEPCAHYKEYAKNGACPETRMIS